MFADLLPPPTFCMDWYMVGWPASLIVPLALSAALIAMFWLLKRPGKPWRNLLILGLCLGLFVAADFAIYMVGVSFQSLWRTPRYPSRFHDTSREPDADDAKNGAK